MTSGLTLVTGGAGFLGGHVVRHLAEAGVPVRVLDIAEKPADTPARDWVAGSITDKDVLTRAMGGVRQVVHLAAVPHLWARDATVFERVNFQGTRAVLAAARAANVASMVHVSSLTTRIAGPAGGQPRVVTEDDLPPLDEMLGPYPRSKWLAERAARNALAEGLPVRIAIPTMPLGPGDAALTPPTRMTLDFVCGRTPAFVDAWLNLCDVRDMAAGIVRLLDAPPEAHGYLLGGPNIKLGDFLAVLGRVSGVKMPTRQVPAWLAEGFAQAETAIADTVTGHSPKAPLTGVRLSRRPVLFDSARAANVLGFKPRPLDATLTDLLAWFEAEGLWQR